MGPYRVTILALLLFLRGVYMLLHWNCKVSPWAAKRSGSPGLRSPVHDGINSYSAQQGINSNGNITHLWYFIWYNIKNTVLHKSRNLRKLMKLSFHKCVFACCDRSESNPMSQIRYIYIYICIYKSTVFVYFVYLWYFVYFVYVEGHAAQLVLCWWLPWGDEKNYFQINKHL